MLYLNRAAEHSLGWNEDELRGRLMHETTHYLREDGSPYPAEECPLIQAARNGDTIRVDDDAFVHRDGHMIPVSYSASPLDRDGADGSSVVVFSDMTRSRSEAARVEAERNLLAWVGRVRDALDEDRLVLYAQPIVDVRTHEVVQHELLVRMLDARDRTRVINPATFLPAAEKYGLIEEIDAWVIGQAAVLAGEGHAIEFNLSADSVTRPGLVTDIERAFARAGADPTRVICEITETGLLRNELLGSAFARYLTSLGFGLALDDFGAGYGGFSYLTMLPITHLKIDRSFIRNLPASGPNQHIVQAIVTLAQGLGLKTVAEGIEDGRTLEIATAIGIDYAQGFLVGRPEPVESLRRPARHRGRSRSSAQRAAHAALARRPQPR